MERLEQTHPYFVRCIKSNSNKVAAVFYLFNAIICIGKYYNRLLKFLIVTWY